LTSSIHDPDEVLDYTTDPQDLFLQWSDQIDLMIDCGYGGNNPSTVVDLTVSPPETIRQGAGIL
jgi:tRNA A37 threonylcarbamoyladenosine synthetase subunit TsaC/SUA5/YrdC